MTLPVGTGVPNKWCGTQPEYIIDGARCPYAPPASTIPARGTRFRGPRSVRLRPAAAAALARTTCRMLLIRPARPPCLCLVHARRHRWRGPGLGGYERQLHAVATRIAPAAPPPVGGGDARRHAKFGPTHRGPLCATPCRMAGVTRSAEDVAVSSPAGVGRRPSASTVNADIIEPAHAICTCITTVRISGCVRIHRSCRPNHKITSPGPTSQPIARVGIVQGRAGEGRWTSRRLREPPLASSARITGPGCA
jgi:hypothetical protein